MLREALEQTGVAGLIGWNGENNNDEDIIRRAWAAALYPFQLAISPTAIKIYLTLILFLSTSFVLLSISTTAFGLFYYKFIPQTDLERPIYLQYEADKFPHAEIPLKTNVLISQQPYDVYIVLHMPRCPVNLGAGNFMLDLALHGQSAGLEASVLEKLNIEGQASGSVTHRARRPAILPYASALSDLISRAVRLPLHLLSFHDSDSITLKIPMFEEVEFARGKDNIPTLAVLEIQSQRAPQPLSGAGQTTNLQQAELQIYSAKLVFQVRFHGLRYLIYNYRTIAFAIFSTLFYTVSISTLALVWAVLATVFRTPDDSSQAVVKTEKDQTIKQEPGQDTSEPLRTTDYKSDKPAKIRGAEDSENETVNLRETWTGPGPGTEFTPQTSEQASAASQPVEGDGEGESGAPDEHADDEEEGSEDEWQQLERLRKRMEYDARQRQLAVQQIDSGLGTSMESENTGAGGSGPVRRTSSGRRGKGKDER